MSGIECQDVDIVNGPNQDLKDDATWLALHHQLEAGKVCAVVAGPPCTTFSKARTGPPGPRPLRSAAHPYGLPRSDLSLAEQDAVAEGTLYALQTLQFLDACHRRGVAFALESPEPVAGVTSIFDLPEAQRLARAPGVRQVDFDQCRWGAESKKPTRILYFGLALEGLEHRCDHAIKWHHWTDFRGRARWSHGTHPPLKDRLNAAGKFATSAAQAYPAGLIAALAASVAQRAAHFRGAAVAGPDGPGIAQADGSADVADKMDRGVERPLMLRGAAPPARRSVRAAEDAAAVGGLRNPADASRHSTGDESRIATIREGLMRAVERLPEMQHAVAAVLAGQEPLAPPEEVEIAAVAASRRALGLSGPPSTHGVQADVIAKWLEASGDPDTILSQWARDGAPLGVERPVEQRGIFPPVPKVPASEEDIANLASSPAGWSNYQSAESQPAVAAALLQGMVDKGWADQCPSWAQLQEIAGGPPVLNRLGLISKQRPDGSLKHRLVWDLRRSGVNSVVAQGERVVLPRVLDVARDAQRLARDPVPGQRLWLFGTDISDAFHQVPLHPVERRYTAAEFQGQFYIFKVLVFGSASAPTVWGRFAALAGRSLAALFGPLGLRVQVYVDDPAFVVAGEMAHAARVLSAALCWLLTLGLPVAWPKCDGGKSIKWIGAQFCISGRELTISLPPDKAGELLKEADAILARPVVPRTRLRSLAGRLAFLAGLVPTVRPFLRPLWKECAPGAPAAVREQRTLPPTLVQVARFRHGLRWCAAFLREVAGPLVRTIPLVADSPQPCLVVATDASPWGLGGVLFQDGWPVEYFADPVRECDHARFGRPGQRPGDLNTCWEGLAILCALRLWRRPGVKRIKLELRADSLAALHAVGSGRSGSQAVSLILRELALDTALLGDPIGGLRHVPGRANVLPDALSRLWAPERARFPAALHSARRVEAPSRGSSFWRTSRPPR